ncbi:MAG: hypothetical protein AUH85_03415 [Chloroflexi bacterium 13_1_40CM_4_68_4]|nr:MAG: hypothetical protein AUH85_03415 [Chloroflexi bacterium 13_1_40CM_4_68_4]
MLFYYLCTVGEKLQNEKYPNGAQTKEADVYKWVTMYSGSPAICQQPHSETHRWRPDEGGGEERVCRYFAVLQWDAHGFPLDERKPDVAERWDSPWGPSLVLERDDDPEMGTYLLLRVYAHGYDGKPGEIGTARPDVPKELQGVV